MLAKRVKDFRNGGASVGEAVAAAAAAAGTGRGCRCFKESTAPNGTAKPLLRLAAVPGATAAFLARVREARPVDWCANVCGNGQYYDETCKAFGFSSYRELQDGAGCDFSEVRNVHPALCAGGSGPGWLDATFCSGNCLNTYSCNNGNSQCGQRFFSTIVCNA